MATKVYQKKKFIPVDKKNASTVFGGKYMFIDRPSDSINKPQNSTLPPVAKNVNNGTTTVKQQSDGPFMGDLLKKVGLNKPTTRPTTHKKNDSRYTIKQRNQHYYGGRKSNYRPNNRRSRKRRRFFRPKKRVYNYWASRRARRPFFKLRNILASKRLAFFNKSTINIPFNMFLSRYSGIKPHLRKEEYSFDSVRNRLISLPTNLKAYSYIRTFRLKRNKLRSVRFLGLRPLFRFKSEERSTNIVFGKGRFKRFIKRRKFKLKSRFNRSRGHIRRTTFKKRVKGGVYYLNRPYLKRLLKSTFKRLRYLLKPRALKKFRYYAKRQLIRGRLFLPRKHHSGNRKRRSLLYMNRISSANALLKVKNRKRRIKFFLSALRRSRSGALVKRLINKAKLVVFDSKGVFSNMKIPTSYSKELSRRELRFLFDSASFGRFSYFNDLNLSLRRKLYSRRKKKRFAGRYIPDYILGRFRRPYLRRRVKRLLRPKNYFLNAGTPSDRVHSALMKQRLSKFLFSRKAYRSLKVGSRFTNFKDKRPFVRSFASRLSQISFAMYNALRSLNDQRTALSRKSLKLSYVSWKRRAHLASPRLSRLLYRGLSLRYLRAQQMFARLPSLSIRKGKLVTPPFLRDFSSYSLWFRRNLFKLRRTLNGFRLADYKPLVNEEDREVLLRWLHSLRSFTGVASNYAFLKHRRPTFALSKQFGVYPYKGILSRRDFLLLKGAKIPMLKYREKMINRNRYVASRFFYNLATVSTRRRRTTPNSFHFVYGKKRTDRYQYRTYNDELYWWKLRNRAHLALFERYKDRSKLRHNRKKKGFSLSSKRYHKRAVVSRARTYSNANTKVLVVLRRAENNFFVNVMRGGKTIFMSTTGMIGFRGPKRRSWFAANKLLEQVATKLLKRGYRSVDVQVRSDLLSKHVNEALKGLLKTRLKLVKKGANSYKKRGRRGVKVINRSLKVSTLVTNYSRAHNGLRARKSRRL